MNAKRRVYIKRILQAYIDGKQIQWSSWAGEWNNLDPNETVVFNFRELNYRVKPGRPKAKK